MTSPHTGRVIIRAKEIFLDSYLDIVKEWAELCGAPYGNDDDIRDWHNKNFVRVAGIDDRRMHVVIDMGKDDVNPRDSDSVPLTLYRYTKDSQGKGYDFPSLAMRMITDESRRTFRLFDPEKQAHLYDIFREYTRTFPWGKDKEYVILGDNTDGGEDAERAMPIDGP